MRKGWTSKDAHVVCRQLGYTVEGKWSTCPIKESLYYSIMLIGTVAKVVHFIVSLTKQFTWAMYSVLVMRKGLMNVHAQGTLLKQGKVS